MSDAYRTPVAQKILALLAIHRTQPLSAEQIREAILAQEGHDTITGRSLNAIKCALYRLEEKRKITAGYVAGIADRSLYYVLKGETITRPATARA